MLLNNQEITEEIKEEIKKYLETKDNENTMAPNLWDAEKAVLRGKFIAIKSYLKKTETSQIKNWTPTSYHIEKSTQNVSEATVRIKTIKVLEENIGVNFMTLDQAIFSPIWTLKHKQQKNK